MPSPPSSPPLPARESSTSPLPPRSKLQLLTHFRRRSNPSQARNRSSTAYEAWIDAALFLAHAPTTEPGASSGNMARIRSNSASDGNAEGSRAQRQSADNGQQNLQGHTREEMPTIRLIPHHDPRSNRPSLTFPATSRTLPHEDCVIRVGRYSERDVNPMPTPNTPSAAPIGFKSKVVSRRHCEFWCSQGQWYIKDVKSSSGTFLNHIRLSQPNMESRPFPVNDGDVVQLGIDFRGGEEMIFRCVKIRVECNRGWQKQLNNYNMSTHKRLRDLAKTIPKKDSDTASTHSSQECSICLMSIAPCQSLFVAPCSHVWHYKCIRPILNDHKHYPQFLCPNCRAITDLDADVDDPLVRWEEEGDPPPTGSDSLSRSHGSGEAAPSSSQRPTEADDTQLGDGAELVALASQQLSCQDNGARSTTPSEHTDVAPHQARNGSLRSRRNASNNDVVELRLPPHSVEYLRPVTPTEPILIPEPNVNGSNTETPNMDQLVRDGPMTPTNTAGPFVFDGSAGRVSGRNSEDLPAVAV